MRYWPVQPAGKREDTIMPVIDVAGYQAGLSGLLLAPEPGNTADFGRQMRLPNGSAEQRQALVNQRLGIYRNNVIHSLTEAMAAQYPIVKKLVGEAFFLALARDYVRAAPPQEPALTFYGETFPDFIAGHAHCRPLPYLPDVARLEWLCQRVLHAPDDAELPPQALAAVDPALLGDVSLHVKQALALFSSRFPVVEIRQGNLKTTPGTVNLDHVQGSHVLVFRKGIDVKVLNLSPSAFLMLEELRRGRSISDSWDTVSSCFSLNDEALPPLLANLLGLGLFSAYDIDNRED